MIENDAKLIEFVTRCYHEILNRDPDDEGLIHYVSKIKNKEMLPEEISYHFMNSEEYMIRCKKREEFDVNFFEKKIYSQNGEDGILSFIFSVIGTTNKFFVEFGVENGSECNTRYLLEEKGWGGLMMDASANDSSHIKKELVTAENVNYLFHKYSVPCQFDLLSIDIDSNDYWIWKAIQGFFPRVVVIEYNSKFSPHESKVIEYDPMYKWDNTSYFGASLLALVNLGKSKGYTLVGCDSNGVNAFFIKNELVNGIKIKNIEELYRPPKYGAIINGVHVGHPTSNRRMLDI